MTQRVRGRLPDTRNGYTRKIVIADTDVYVRTGEYASGRLGELFVLAGKPGETVQGLLDAVGIAVSIGLQYGIPIDVFCDKFEHTQFPPSQTGVASSPLDAIFRYLRERYGRGASAVAGPAVAGPAVAGPAVAGPAVAGPVVAGPAVAGPVVAGPVVAGPVVAGPAVVEVTGRCRGDGEHGCGHVVHEGPCLARFVVNGLVRCACRGSGRQAIEYTLAPTAVIHRNGRILLARRPADKVFGGCWETPGGKAESGESAVEALARELLEELGVSAVIGELLCEVLLDPPMVPRGYRIPAFAVEIESEPRALASDEVRWFALDEVANLNLTPATTTVLIEHHEKVRVAIDG